MNNKVQRECAYIAGIMPTDDSKRNAVAWAQAAQTREQFLQELREQGLKGKQYSNAVVAYDKQNMRVF